MSICYQYETPQVAEFNLCRRRPPASTISAGSSLTTLPCIDIHSSLHVQHIYRERDHYTPRKCLYSLSITNQQAGTAAGLITLYDDRELLLLLWYGGCCRISSSSSRSLHRVRSFYICAAVCWVLDSLVACVKRCVGRDGPGYMACGLMTFIVYIRIVL